MRQQLVRSATVYHVYHGITRSGVSVKSVVFPPPLRILTYMGAHEHHLTGEVDQ